jgi:adenine-specific DNA-methyltransferase
MSDESLLNPTVDRAAETASRLAKEFDANASYYLSPSYQEAEVRKDFIDKFLFALGWDVNHDIQRNPFEQEVKVERSVHMGATAQRRADYSIAIAPEYDTPVLYVEAKKPHADIATADNYFQTIRYANQRSHPIGVLTDFEQLHIVDCRYQANIQTAIHRSLLRFHYSDYLNQEKFAAIFFLLSRPAVYRGSIQKYAESLPVPKGRPGQKSFVSLAYKPLDEYLLETLDGLRESLARSLKIKNQQLDSAALTELTQRILDRLVFIRFLEDKLIEPVPIIPSLGESSNRSAWQDFVEVSGRLDKIYNGIVFKHHDLIDVPGKLTVDDKSFADVLDAFDFHKSEYLFSDIPIHILGSIYERFLGNVIVATEKRATLDPKPEVRKAGGVYYTPRYIVDYIVENTIGKLIDGKSPTEISELRFADIACGSGSFLLGIYSYLLKYVTRWYNTRPQKAPKNAVVRRSGALYLSLAEKSRILCDSIFGVDIDPQAVEVAQLSLYLKLLEDETTASARQYTMDFHQPLLPSLTENIKCGNSLVASDFNAGKQFDFLDAEVSQKLNTFDWSVEFRAIMESGGFDAIVGNPPWGADFDAGQLAYLRVHQARVVDRMVDSYIYFFDKAMQLAKADGSIGFIVPSTILNQVDARALRGLLIQRRLSHLINLGRDIFTRKVLNTSTIVIASKASFVCEDFSALPVEQRPTALVNTPPFRLDWQEWVRSVEVDPHLTFFLGEQSETSLLARLRTVHPPLTSCLDGEIQRGVSPDIVAAHVLTPSEVTQLNIEADVLRKSISGPRIKRYSPCVSDQWIIYTSRETEIGRYPRAYDYLKRFRSKNTCKEVAAKKHPFWSLHRPRNPQIFASPKFIGITTSKRIELVYDANESLFVTDAMYVFRANPETDALALMALMQSRLFLFLYRVANQGESRVIPQIKASKLQTIPTPQLSRGEPAASELQGLAIVVQRLQARLPNTVTEHARTLIERQIATAEGRINEIVYELYGLTSTEIKMVEKATR